jgi:hypothetical protein
MLVTAKTLAAKTRRPRFMSGVLFRRGMSGPVHPIGKRTKHDRVGSSEAQIAEARIDLGRIGMRVEAGHVATPEPMGLALPCRPGPAPVPTPSAASTISWSGDGPAASWSSSTCARRGNGGPGTCPIRCTSPSTSWPTRVGELPDGRMLWSIAPAGFRAALGASLLARVGRRTVLVDDRWAEVAPEEVEVQSEAA